MSSTVNRSGIVRGSHPPGKQDAARQMRRNPTPAEALLWQHLRAGRLNGLHFRRQQVIDSYIVDFYCHAAGLVVELDGSVHVAQAEYDALRQQAIERRGLQVLRFPNQRVLDDLDGVLREILALALTLMEASSTEEETYPPDPLPHGEGGATLGGVQG